jgi:DNA-directed RNA polymerase subunit delta
MTSRSMCDVAFEILSSKTKEVPFIALWDGVVAQMGFTPSQAENKIAQFYSALMLDVRFAPLEGNVWDLRTRRTYHEVHVDTSKILIEEEFSNMDDDDEYIVNEDEVDFDGVKKEEEEE